MASETAEITEIFKSIHGYENYHVSNAGNVVNAATGRVLKGGANKDGYLRVGLYKDGTEKKFLVHRLVLEYFYGPCPEGPFEADHIDRNCTNNAIANLRWVTKAMNKRNQRLQCNNTSGLRDVSKRGNHWLAQLFHNGQHVLRRACSTKREAALIYIGALNEIDEEDGANAQAEYDNYDSEEESDAETVQTEADVMSE